MMIKELENLKQELIKMNPVDLRDFCQENYNIKCKNETKSDIIESILLVETINYYK